MRLINNTKKCNKIYEKYKREAKNSNKLHHIPNKLDISKDSKFHNESKNNEVLVVLYIYIFNSLSYW